MDDLISVIIPVYKVEKLLRRCVQSVIDQSYINLEIILVDDGSPDNCGVICDELAQADSRVKVIHKKNGGLSDARNAGIDIATGDWIGFVDSDDYIASDMYENLLSLCRRTGADIAVCKYICVLEDETAEFKTSGEFRVIEDPFREFICNKCCAVNVWNKLYKKELFGKIRYPVGILYEDLATTYKLIDCTKKIVISDSEHYAYVQRSDSIMGNTRFMMKQDKVQIVNEMWDYIEQKDIEDRPKLFLEVLEFCITDMFKMLGKKTWVKDKDYRLSLKDLVKKKKRIINRQLDLSKYRKIVLIMALNFPIITQFIFSLKRR